jgi:hypothetical protein
VVRIQWLHKLLCWLVRFFANTVVVLKWMLWPQLIASSAVAKDCGDLRFCNVSISSAPGGSLHLEDGDRNSLDDGSAACTQNQNPH